MLNLIFFLAGGAGAISVCAATTLSFWWLLPLWIGLYLGITLVFFLLFLLLLPFATRKPNPEKPSAFCMGLLHFMTAWLMGFLWVRVKKEGFEKIPAGPVVFVANHISNFDPIVVMSAYAGKLIFISKESNFHIPIAGALMKKAGYLSIDRENSMRALRTLKTAAELVENEAVSVGIYPEGTRSKSGELQEFKDGAFYLAKHAKVPVVLLATSNTQNIRPTKRILRPLTVKLRVLDVWSPEKIEELPMPELSKQAHDCILAGLSKL